MARFLLKLVIVLIAWNFLPPADPPDATDQPVERAKSP
jgi:hypothetical protein